MRDFLKSMFRFSWAMSLFGANSMGNLFAPAKPNQPGGRVATALDAVSRAAEQQLSSGFRAAFQAGDNLQRSIVDTMLGRYSSADHMGPTVMQEVPGACVGEEMVSNSLPEASQGDPPPVVFGGLITSTEKMRTYGPPTLHVKLSPTTQGPTWPPAAQCDGNGDFILVGSVLTEVSPGKIVPVPRGAVIVSKDTIPPLNEQGKEDFSNPFGAPYKVIRNLDLSPGSRDLDLVLHSVSWGPFEGDWGGGAPRMPRLGESKYNLNSFATKGLTSPELFPSASQRRSYTRASFPLHKVPIMGFQGDQVAYDVDTGDPYTPVFRGGSGCPPEGCGGEDVINFRRQEPITLGEWLRAEVWLTITLCNFKRTNGPYGVYTAARFDVQARNLLPNSFYTIMMIRSSQFHPSPLQKIPDASVLPNAMITDWQGTARSSRVIPNAFPDPATDDAGLRIVGVGIGFKPDFAIWGAYPFRLNPGADIHAQVTSFADGTRELTSFITAAP
jgi:hypothetical protein